MATVSEASLTSVGNLIGASEKIQKELRFQTSKQFVNKVHSYLDHALVESEVPEDMKEVAQAFLEARSKLDMSRVKKSSKLDSLLSPCPVSVGNQLVFADDEALVLGISSARIRVATQRDLASFFVAADPANPGQRTSWTVALQGASIVDRKYIESKGAKGVAFTYSPAIATRRKIFVCQKFQTSHPLLFDILKVAVNKPHSKWKLLTSWEQFAAAAETAYGSHVPVRQRRQFDVLALTLPEVVKTLSLPNVFCKSSFLKSTSNFSCTRRGVCGS